MKRDLLQALEERILVIDGALGTMIQSYKFREGDFRGREFINHPTGLAGYNDILNITRPASIIDIHTLYLEAGADIITTNTFNSNPISMKDYGLDSIEGLTRRLNREGAKNARRAIEEYESRHIGKKQHYVGGSIGPTNRSASMSPDIGDPLKRNISYDELFNAFRLQTEGLIEGGVDLLICETFFDTLNLKAAVAAANSVMRQRGINLPILVSATVSDNAGRILSGQTLEAFIASVEHLDNIAVIGLNCGFGPDRMIKYVGEINKTNTHFTSCHPNAGMPDEKGCYTVSPEDFAMSIRPIIEGGNINIVGGCCGTTPAHIKLISDLVETAQPRKREKNDTSLQLSGLDLLTVDKDFLTVGERCNVAGSAKFIRLIKEGNLEEAAEIAKSQIEKGAKVIDINLDDPLLDAKEEMIRLLRYILAEPDIARVPFMIDSSKWEVIESSLKEIQGKGIVNSLSLKEGEEKFLEKARKVKDLGFALVVMAFDEKGQADTFERKVEVCQRAYQLLVGKCGFNPHDIIFDVNVMTIATGMKEDARYAIDFINTVEWIKKNLPCARLSGGISNLSFAFRGKNKIREYMHVTFLHHARRAGLDMAIISPAQKTKYEEIPTSVREVIEDIIFDRDDSAIDKLIELAEIGEVHKERKKESFDNLSDSSPAEALKQMLIKGELKGLDTFLAKTLEEFKDPVAIIEGPLLSGMKRVGELFGEGKMFLPQVVKTARAMKKAVEILTPKIEKSRKGGGEKNGKILIATVKGDVHDIGKNIVSTVLACNNYEIIDLGIMVSAEKIVETALKENPDIICLSGLITPSLGEMTETVRQLEASGVSTPVMVGGAATSLAYTAIHISPAYSGSVFHMTDASQNPIAANKLLNPDTRQEFIRETEKKYECIREKNAVKEKIVPFNEALLKVAEEKRNDFIATTPTARLSEPLIIDLSLDSILPLINWKMFFLAWKIQGKYLDTFPYKGDDEVREAWLKNLDSEEKEKANEALQLYREALKILEEIGAKDFDGKAVVNFLEARGDLKNIYIGGKVFPMLRQQREDTGFLSVSDFIGREKGFIGLFAVTAGNRLYAKAKDWEKKGDTYRALILQTLSDRIAEAGSEWLQKSVNAKYWPVDIRPAWGYPMMPDQTLILQTQYLLPFEKIGISLTENGAMFPPASVSGFFISNSSAKYFRVGQIGEDQLEDYSLRRGESVEKIREILRF